MENVKPVLRLRQWWASQVPTLKRPSPTRFFIWLAFFAASGAAFFTLSRGWIPVGFFLMIAGNVVLWPKIVKPAPNLTSREFFIAAAVLIIAVLVYLTVGLPSIPTPSPPVARVAIAILWVAVVASQWRRTFASPPTGSA